MSLGIPWHYFQTAFVRGRHCQGVDVGLAEDLLLTDLDLLKAENLEAILQAVAEPTSMTECCVENVPFPAGGLAMRKNGGNF